MSKRPAESSTSTGQAFSKVSTNGAKRDIDTAEMGEFEDDWEDELESDEEVVDGEERVPNEEG